ncbi:hypothetical protein SDRG_01133 [Saprolegnia diclina VS20]|uniref:Uncharacterized protein n=1 Tax=Saprolegnia diclina (strain VS20) TaxID=1156394 RepID=T0R486_SAPDV|nr:hypothetical protein SDRG_01133 [Saprolegnia diclina VS20]EQC41155.1 hypothetical protein SDRG_01133 [Saprolegnia diclina VS20]|eukprot:XP_008604869.1 hypothetical protein SDRG_01133 [Saprolegnia diclina VS20]
MPSGFKENYCADCFLQFESAVDFSTHRAKFCVQSEYGDPAKLEAALAEPERPTLAALPPMSLAQAQAYLSAPSMAPGLGQLSLRELKANVTANDRDMEKLKAQLQRDRAREKADEVRALKVRQQQALFQKQREDDEIEALLMEIERRKQDELQARLSQEQIKQELHALDLAGIASLEEAKKRDLAELQNAKEALQRQEDAALRDIEALEKRVKDQERQHRELERTMLEKLQDADAPEVGDDRSKALRSKHMERSRAHGVATANLEQQRRELLAQQAQLRRALGSNQEADPLSMTGFDYSIEQERVERLAKDVEVAGKAQAAARIDMETQVASLLLVREDPVDVQIDHLLQDLQPAPCAKRRSTNQSPPRARTRAKTPPPATLPPSDSLEELTRQHTSRKRSRPPTPARPLTTPPVNISTPVVSIPTTATPTLATNPTTTAPSTSGYPPGMYPQGPSFAQHPAALGPYPASGSYLAPGPYLAAPAAYSAPGPYPASMPWGFGSPYMYQQPPPYYSGMAGVGAAFMGYPPFAPPFPAPPDSETAKLQAQLDELKQLQEQREFERETSRFQQLLQSLQGTGPEKSVSSETPSDEPAELRALRLQHAQEMLRIQHERNLIEEQEKLRAVREGAERRRKEADEQLEHDEWVAKQKRMVLALRMKKVLAKEQGANSTVVESSVLPYDPDLGFVIFWDFVLCVPLKAPCLQLTYALYDQTTTRSKHKLVRAHECEPHGLSHQRCVFATRRDFEQMPASPHLRLLVEVAMVASPTEPRARAPASLGWTAVDIFLPSLELQEGCFKLPLSFTPLPQASAPWALPLGEDDASAKLYVRIVHAAQAEEASKFPVNPDSMADKYTLPPNQMQPAAPTSPGPERPPEKKAPKKLAAVTPNESPDSIATPPLPIPPETTTPLRPVEVSRPATVMSERNVATQDETSVQPKAKPPVIASPIPTSRLYAHSDELEDSVFLDCDNTSQRRRQLFARGDGVNLYIDGARSLPDCTSVTKATVFAFHSDMTLCTSLSETSALCSVQDKAVAPTFRLLVEFRDERFNPTLTVVVRLDTIAVHSKSPTVLGYVAVPVFLDADGQQPTKPSMQDVYLNDGAFQVPLRTGITLGSSGVPMTAKACESALKLSCATLLLRIARAPKSEDGLRCLSRKDAPATEWEAQRIVLPAPAYASRAYDSTSARPSAMEEKLYELRRQRKPRLVGELLQSTLGVDTERLPAVLADQLEKKPKTSLLDMLSSIFVYQPEIGFRVAIDGLHNLPSSTNGSFVKVIASVAPPAAFYQTPQLTDDVQMTVSYDWTSASSSPEFSDGYHTYRDVMPSAPLLLVLDVRCIKMGKAGDWSSAPLGWTYLKLLHPESRGIVPGSFQLPLFAGNVTLDVLQHDLDMDLLVAQEVAKKKGLIAYIPGASLLLRIEDGQLPNVCPTPFTKSEPKGIPSSLLPKYAYDPSAIQAQRKKKPLSKLLPPKRSEQELEKELNVAFAAEMGITHYAF